MATAAELIVKIGAQVDEFKKGIADAGNSLAQGVQNFQKTATQFAIAGGTITAALGFMAKAAMEEEEAIAKVARAVSSSQVDFENTRQILSKFGNEMEEKFPFSAEQYMSAIQLLVTRGHVPLDKAMDASTAMLRFMADTGMEGKRALQYINQEAKMGHDVLSEYAKKAELPLSPLERLRVASQTWGNIMEEIGAEIVPILLEIAEKVQVVKKWWDALLPTTKQTVIEIVAMAAAGMTVIGMLGKLAGIIMSLNPLMLAYLAAVIAIVEALKAWQQWNINEQLKKQTVAMDEVNKKMKEELKLNQEKYDKGKISFKEWMAEHKRISEAYSDRLGQIVTEAKEDKKTTDIKKNNLAEVTGLIQKYYKDISELNKNKDEEEKKSTKLHLDELQAKAGADSEYYLQLLLKEQEHLDKKSVAWALYQQEVDKTEKELADKHISLLETRAGSDSQYLLDLLTKEQQSTVDKSAAWWEYKNAIDKVQEEIRRKNLDTIQQMTSDFSFNFIDKFRTSGDIFGSFQSAWQTLVDDVVRTWERMLADMIAKTLASGILDMVNGFFSGAGGGGGGGGGTNWTSIGATLGSIIPGVGTVVGGLVGGIADFFGFAEGGDFMVNKPTPFIAGEKGLERVTVTPIKAGSTSTTTNNRSISINIYGGNKSPYQLYQELQPYIESANPVRRLGVREYYR